MEHKNQNIYDTTIYTDFNDLPEETKKALYSEWLKGHPAEKRTNRLCRFVPLAFAVLAAIFLIASAVVAIVVGFDIPCIILLVVAIIALVVFVVFNEYASRIIYDQSIRYAAWLKKEKRVVAEIKPRKGK